jgi:hypothetical protein
MKGITIFIIAVLSVCVINNLKAQQSTFNSKMEDDIYVLFKRLDSAKISIDKPNGLSEISRINNSITSKLLLYLRKYPSSLSYGFSKLLKEKVKIATSSDGKIRIYSWDTWTGGTMRGMNSIIQYKRNGNVFAKVLFDAIADDSDDAGSFYEKIFTVKGNTHTYYLAIGESIYSSMDVGESLKVFSIDKNGLNDTIRIIKDQTGLHDKIEIFYNYSSYINNGSPKMHFDSLSNIFLVPIVNDKEVIVDIPGALTRLFRRM